MTDPRPRSERDEQQDKKWYEKTLPLFVLTFGGIVFCVLVLGLILDWYIDPGNSPERKGLIQALGLITAGVAGAVGIFFTWRGQRQTREAQEENQQNTLAQLSNAQEELTLTRQGQITERFTRAIDQLGATDDKGKKKLEIRLGGIYALERIDKESPERAYHPTVMEVLTAYVRENSRQDHEKPSTPTSVCNEPTEQDKDTVQEVEPTSETPPADIQAILDVLKRREEDCVPEKHRIQYLGLYGSDLRRAVLTEAHLKRADLRRVNLEGAELVKAHLEEAYLPEAHLERALLVEAHLKKAELIRAHLEGAKLVKAHLEGADLRRVNLEGAHLFGAHLEGANLIKAQGLSTEQIYWAIGDEETRLPEGLVRPVAWSESPEEQRKIIEQRLKQEPELRP